MRHLSEEEIEMRIIDRRVREIMERVIAAPDEAVKLAAEDIRRQQRRLHLWPIGRKLPKELRRFA
jgi:hypothetical protein